MTDREHLAYIAYCAACKFDGIMPGFWESLPSNVQRFYLMITDATTQWLFEETNNRLLRIHSTYLHERRCARLGREVRLRVRQEV